MAITIYNGANSQVVSITGLVDTGGTVASGATISGKLVRSGVDLAGSTLTFTEDNAIPGNYSAPLSGFDASRGSAQLHIDGSKGLTLFSFVIPVTISVRSS